MKFIALCFLLISLLGCSGQKKLYEGFISGNEDSLSGIKFIRKDENAIEIFNMKNGAKNGAYAAYSTEGSLMIIGRYKKNKRIGTWYWYSPSGQVYRAAKFTKKNVTSYSY